MPIQDPFFDYLPAGTEEKWESWFFQWKHLQKRNGFIGNVISESQRLLDMLPDFLRRHYPGPVVEGVFLEGVNFKEFFEREPGALVVLNIPYLDPTIEAEQIGAYAFFLQFTRNWLTANGCRFILTTHPDTFVAIMHEASDYFSVASHMIHLVDLKALIERAEVPLPEPIVPQAKLDALMQAQADVKASAKEDKGYHLFNRLRELKCLADLARWSEVLNKANALKIEAQEHGDPSIVEDTMGWQAMAHLRLHQHHAALRIANELLGNPEIDSSSAVYWEALSVKAEVLDENGELVEAQRLLDQLVAHQRRRNEDKLAEALLNFGNLKAKLGEFDIASRSFQEAVEIGDRRNLPDMQIRGKTGEALVLIRKGELISAFKLLTRAEQAARAAGEAELLVKVLFHQVKVLSAWGRKEEAAAILKEILIRSANISDEQIRAVCYFQIVPLLENQGARRAAIDKLIDARSLFQKLHDKVNEIEALLWLALLWGKEGAINSSLRATDEAISVCKSIGDDELYAKCLSLKSQVMIELKHYSQALNCSEEALQILRRRGNQFLLLQTLNDHARSLGVAWRLDTALGFSDEAIVLAQMIGVPQDIARASMVKAAILATAGRLEEAVHLHEKAISIYKKLGDFGKLTASFSSQANLLWRTNQPQAAINLLQLAIQEVNSYPGYKKQLEVQLQDYLSKTVTNTTAHDTSFENTDPPSPPGAPA